MDVSKEINAIIETERLLLREFNINDAQAMFNNWANDLEVTQYMTWNPHKDVNETKMIIRKWLAEYKKENTYRFAIVLKPSNELIGSIDVVDYVNGNPEIGYCLSRKHWNKGYMTEALNSFIDFLFKQGFKEIVIEAMVENLASNRVIEKCGFTFTHQEGKICSPFKPTPIVVNWYSKTIEKH